MAGAKFPAFVVAHTGKGPEPVMVPDDAAALVAPQPIGLLPLPRDVRAVLLRFGLLLPGRCWSCSQKEVLDSTLDATPWDRRGDGKEAKKIAQERQAARDGRGRYS